MASPAGTMWEITEEDVENATDLKFLDVNLDLHGPPVPDLELERYASSPPPLTAPSSPQEYCLVGSGRNEHDWLGTPLMQRDGLPSRPRESEQDICISILETERYNFRNTAQRLLWVDGKYTDPRGPSTPAKDTTLIVLKFPFSSITGARMKPLEYVHTTLTFGAAASTGSGKDTGAAVGEGPEVVAWAPFNRTERVNKTEAQMSKSTQRRRAGRLRGRQRDGHYSRTDGVAWPRTYFDEYSSTAVTAGTRPVTVRWELKQNALQNHGVLPYFFATVLITRPSAAVPYLAKFTMQVRGGRLDRTMHRMGLANFVTHRRTFRCTPGPADEVCVLEGKDIRSRVDLTDFGRLIDAARTTELRIPYRLGFDQEGEQLAAAIAETAAPTTAVTTTAGSAIATTDSATFCAAVPAFMEMYTKAADVGANDPADAIDSGVNPPIPNSPNNFRSPQPPASEAEDLSPDEQNMFSSGNAETNELRTRLSEAEANNKARDEFIAVLQNALRDVREDLRGLRMDLQGNRSDLHWLREELHYMRRKLQEAKGNR
ncbi:hypothetical protein SPI_08802 [Niveomyces insectorum RCEF 264]|uniref:Uncharacterized protein n=1 Tax=Niveomyces insectorum RCEF 264 TaxID=1081102 RepID=A0A167MN03_9HYPO|nr:hypothetical protein SPI_08802 [Niveomyces insectorum RCEF 264]